VKKLDDYRFLDPELQKCPYEFYKLLREEAPVWREPETGYYIVTRHADILEAKSAPEIFSNDVPPAKKRGASSPPEAQEILAKGWERPQTLHRTDPPAHTHYRKLIDRTFTLPRVREMIPYIEGVVRDLFDAFPENGEVDFVRQYAVPLPCMIIADQLGVPREDALKLRLWSDGLLDPVGLMVSPEREIECAKLVLQYQNYFADRIAERQKEPKDDILTALSQRLDGEAPYSLAELLNMLEQIVTGGNESTAGLLASGLLMLIDNPEQEQALREDPSRIPTFVLWTDHLMAWLERRDESLDIAILGNLRVLQDPEAIFQEGLLHCDRGLYEAGLNEIQAAVAKGYFIAPTLARSRQFDALRSNPVFQRVVADAEAGSARALAAFRDAGGERLLGM